MATKKPTVKVLQQWLHESKKVSQVWRQESWRDCEMFDGGDSQWSQDDWDAANDAGIDQITVNRTFPTIELIFGSSVINKLDIVQKGRTQKDSELGQIMTESTQFVMDQNGGEFIINEAFRDSIIPGFGCVAVGLSSDPRKEKIKVQHMNWLEVGWDPFSSPWWTPETCRYVYHEKWMDLDSLQWMFPDKKRDISNQYEEFKDATGMNPEDYYDDFANDLEEERMMLLGRDWIDGDRKRVRPVTMWYPIFETSWFASFSDGRVIEMSDDRDGREIVQIVSAAQAVEAATVPKMHISTFFGDLLLQECPSPHPHDQYPLVPFVGYIDRYQMPYGVPRQIRGQDIEINKRRSMALALMSKVKVLAEKDVVEGGNEALQNLYEESQKIGGLIIVKNGKLRERALQLDSEADLSRGQMDLYKQSEEEINEISGSNEERRGIETNANSGKAIEARQRAGAVMTASLFENNRRSHKYLGELIKADIQGFWGAEKVLRITDRITGAERFSVLNQHILGPDGRTIEVKNDITQGKFDTIVSDAPETDTVRERNLELVTEWVKKSPPEIIPYLMNLAFEMSNLPNKEQLMAQIKPILGINPAEEDLSPQEMKQNVIQRLQAQQQEQAKVKMLEERAASLDLENKDLENTKIRAEIRKIIKEADDKSLEADSKWTKVLVELEKVLQAPQLPQPANAAAAGNNGNKNKSMQVSGTNSVQ